MRVRFSFRMEVCIEGETKEEIQKTYDSILEMQARTADFVETVSVEDADTYDDLHMDFYKFV